MPDKNDLKQDAILKEATRERRVGQFARELERFLSANVPDLLSQVQSGKITALDTANILNELPTALRRAGLNNVIDDVVKVYASELKVIKKQFKASLGKDLPFSGIDAQIIEQLIQFEVTATANKINTYVDDMRAVVYRQVISGVRPSIAQIVDTKNRELTNQIETELNTNMAGFSRSVTLKKAEEIGSEYFYYVGGLIPTSREFCIERDNQVFSAEEVSSWDNGQGVPVIPYLGGYNCRHDLRPVTETWARENGFI